MADGLIPQPGERPGALAQPTVSEVFGSDPGFVPSPRKNPIERPLAAIRRYKWLILAIVSVATLVGVLAMQTISPQYEVRATIVLPASTAGASGGSGNAGPIRVAGLLSPRASEELLRSFRVVDAVVRRLKLFLSIEETSERALFASFDVANPFLPGAYELSLDPAQNRWTLRMQNGQPVDQGAIGDSVGEKAGLLWVLPPSAARRRTPVQIRFTVFQPREKSIELINRIGVTKGLLSNLMFLSFQDANKERATDIVNTWADEYVRVAAELSKGNITDYKKTLEEQLIYAERELAAAEQAEESFKVKTITLPTEAGGVAAGVAETRDPVMSAYFDQKIAYENLRQDREALERMISAARSSEVPYDMILQLPSVAGLSATALREAFDQRNSVKRDLAVARATYTDTFTTVRSLQDRLDIIEKQTIPTLASQLVTQLRDREADYERRIAGASKELQSIPARTMNEMKLVRARNVAENLYQTLKARFAEAQLAEASAAPDLRVLDAAVPPLAPTVNTAPKILAAAVLGGIAFAIGLAILLDMLDGRFRYPDQAREELGLAVAGTVPRLPKKGIDAGSPEQVVQLVESFRSLRMHVMHCVTHPATLAVTSAAPGDGKSLVSANLAMSFAEAGMRTLLVDGDTRRGALHTMFGAQRDPGLTEYLNGQAAIDAIIQPTTHDRLSLVSCGRRDRQSPELLSTNRLPTLVQALRERYDVVIFDTPPLAAGIDGYAISAAAGNLLMVVRIGQTVRRHAAAKLGVAERLPINMVGTVLNGVQLQGEFQYYAYAAGYGDIEAKGELTSTTG